MDEEQSQATQVLWINENEYYFVCSKCHQRYSGPLTPFDRESNESYDQAIDEVTEQQIGCELCEYDIQEFAREVQKGDQNFDEIPEEIKGDVFDRLQTQREVELVDIETVEEMQEEAKNELLDELEEEAKNELLDELGLEEPPKSFWKKQLSEWNQTQQNHLNQLKEAKERVAESSDKLIAAQYGQVLADYKIAMNTDLWTLTQSAAMSELFGYLPMGGFFQPFWESILEDYAISKDAAHNAEIIFEIWMR